MIALGVEIISPDEVFRYGRVSDGCFFSSSLSF